MVWPIFPENGLANSVIPPVLAGLTFSTIFAETLGWNFSGLIVPGYLAPILVVRPFSGIVIIAEAFLTYVILRLLADGFSKMGIWTRFFGQDAFFALLCISILVKCTVEGPLQSTIGGALSQFLPGQFDFRNELHSTGLIVVPLMANIFWRHGLRRNLLPILTNILLTYLFLKYVLIPYTNFSVNKFELMYSKMAVNFEESARYYVILLIGAALANHNKYRYGWSYHGILIPALLGIAWLTPLKILTTFVEALCILVISVQLVKSRIMRNKTIEGPRKLLLLFFIGFLLKMITGFTLQNSIPGFNAMDVYGFAYILPALLAIEMWPGRKLLQVSRITLQTSLLAAVAGLTICTGLQVLYPETFQARTENRHEMASGTTQTEMREVEESLASWLSVAASEQIDWGVNHKSLSMKSLRAMDESILTPLMNALKSGQLINPDEFDKMSRVLKRTGYELVHLTDPTDNEVYYILTESTPFDYRGIYVFRTGASQPVAIQVPQPKSEAGTLPIGIALFNNQRARALLISGTSKRKEFVEFDVTHMAYKKNLFQLVHQVIHREFILSDPILSLQVRGSADLTQSDSDVIISTGTEIRSEFSPSPRVNRLYNDFLRLGLTPRFFRGDDTDLHLSSHSNAQQAYTETFNMGEFVIGWFDSSFRRSFDDPDVDEQLIETLGWQSKSGDITVWLHAALAGEENWSEPPDLELNTLISSITVELDQYSETGNVIHLDRVTSLSENSGYSITDYLDTWTAQHFLVLIRTDPLSQFPPFILCNYFPHSDHQIKLPSGSLALIRSTLDRFSFCHFAAAIPSGELR